MRTKFDNYEGKAVFDPIAYYNPETRIFPALAESFATTGKLDPLGLYVILDWKSPRARTKHRSRLIRIAGSFNSAVDQIGAELHAAASPEQRLGLLLTKWDFLPPTASAILAILYPDTFTIYDIRVCNTLGGFHNLAYMAWSPTFWKEYQRYVGAVRDAASQGLSLRDCDRWLWGQNKRDTLVNELADRD